MQLATASDAGTQASSRGIGMDIAVSVPGSEVCGARGVTGAGERWEKKGSSPTL